MSLEFSQIPHTLEAAKFICELRNDPYICDMSNQPFKREHNAFYHGEFIDRYVTSVSKLSYFIVYEGKNIGVFAKDAATGDDGSNVLLQAARNMNIASKELTDFARQGKGTSGN